MINQEPSFPYENNHHPLNRLPEIKLSLRSTSECHETDALSQYFPKVLPQPVLTAKEELELGMIIQQGRKADGELTTFALQAYHQLVLSNLRLCFYFARRYRSRREDITELIGPASLGLCEAALKFDPAHEVRFSTYAYWSIRSQIINHLREQARPYHLPKNIHEKIAKHIKVRDSLVQKLKRLPTDEELITALGWTREDLWEIRDVQEFAQSLDEERKFGDEEEGQTLAEKLVDPNAVDPAQAAAQNLDGDFLVKLLKKLDKREARILSQRFGLEGPAMTLDEIGAKLQVSRERVRQLEARALKKMLILFTNNGELPSKNKSNKKKPTAKRTRLAQG